MSRHSAGAREVARTAPIFAALGDETRLALVARLSSDGPLSTTRLTAGSAFTRQAVTKHLNVLATAGLAAATVVIVEVPAFEDRHAERAEKSRRH